MNGEYTPKRRWYDTDENIEQFVSLIQVFPEEVQSIICEGIVSLADDQYHAHELLQSVKSLGVETLMNMYKSKNMMRRYDAQPLFHRSMNYFFVLNPDNRYIIAQKSVEVVRYTGIYFDLCKENEETPNLDQVRGVTHTCLRQGGEQAKLFLAGVKETFNRKERMKKTIIHGDKIVS